MDFADFEDQITKGIEDAEAEPINTGEDFLWLLRNQLVRGEISREEFAEAYDAFAENGFGFRYEE